MKDDLQDLLRRIDRLENLTARLPIGTPTSLGGSDAPELNIYQAVLTYDFPLTAAQWNLSATDNNHYLEPGTGYAYKLLPDTSTEIRSDNLYVENELTEIRSWYTKPISVPDPALALIGWFINDELIALDCNYIDWQPLTPEAPE